MIKVDKDLTAIPQSLKTDVESVSKPPAKTTHARRLEVIAQGHYPDSKNSTNYDKRYKYDDIKTDLVSLYHNKCAFCESKLESMHVEHFRPKRGGYYWMAFSWDNLLLSCPTCNIYKSDDFSLSERGVRAIFTNTDEIIQRINTLSSEYDATEKPLLISPETVTAEELASITFSQDGSMSSENVRMQHTIESCKLSRQALCENRKRIWDRLRNHISIAAVEFGVGSERFHDAVSIAVKAFRIESQDIESDYIAFRKYVLSSDWIGKEIRSHVNSHPTTAD